MKQKNYNKIGKRVIATEIASLKKLNKCFGNPFLRALDIISKCSGKLILAGIGKSGLISRTSSDAFSHFSIATINHLFVLHMAHKAFHPCERSGMFETPLVERCIACKIRLRQLEYIEVDSSYIAP